MRSQSSQADPDRYVQPGRPRSTTENIVVVCRRIAWLQTHGEAEEAARVRDLLIGKYPSRAHSISVTIANFITDITTGRPT